MANANMGGERSRSRPGAVAVRGALARCPQAVPEHRSISRRHRRGGDHPADCTGGAPLGRLVRRRSSTVRLTRQRAVDGSDCGRVGGSRWRGAGAPARRAPTRAFVAEGRPERAWRLSHRADIRGDWRARGRRRGRVRTLPAGGCRADEHRRRAFFPAPVQRQGPGGRFRPRAPARRRPLGSGDGHPRGRRVLATAAALASAGDGDHRVARRRRGDHRAGSCETRLDSAPAVGHRGCHRRRLRRRVRVAHAALAARVAGRPARRALRRARRSGDGDVSVALLLRDRGKGTPHRDHVRASGHEPAEGSAGSPLPGTRAD